jgi:hypothetical protein
MTYLPPLTGYIRCAPLWDWRCHIQTDSFQPLVGVLVIDVEDGSIQLQLNSQAAKDLMRKLQAFLDKAAPPK